MHFPNIIFLTRSGTKFLLKNHKTMTALAITKSENILEISHLISYRVLRAGEAHPIAYIFIKTYTIDTVDWFMKKPLI